MSRIAYDPVKDRFAEIIRKSHFLRTLFYKLLDLFFLRSWYVRHILKERGSVIDSNGEWDLLDAGSGFGQYDRFILNTFEHVKVTAVDVKKDYLEDSRSYFSEEVKQKRISFHQADLLELDYKEQFEFAICIDVLEHIDDDRKVIRNIYNSLKPGGYFLMHSPSIYSAEDAGADDSFVDEHARTGYSKEDIRKKTADAGFEPVEIAYTYGPKGHKAWEWLIKYPMLWLNRIKLWALPVMAVYYIFTLPIALILMKLDLRNHNEKGAGIFALVRKP